MSLSETRRGVTCPPSYRSEMRECFSGSRTDCKPRENNGHLNLKRKIEYPVLRYGWADHGGLVTLRHPPMHVLYPVLPVKIGCDRNRGVSHGHSARQERADPRRRQRES